MVQMMLMMMLAKECPFEPTLLPPAAAYDGLPLVCRLPGPASPPASASASTHVLAAAALSVHSGGTPRTGFSEDSVSLSMGWHIPPVWPPPAILLSSPIRLDLDMGSAHAGPAQVNPQSLKPQTTDHKTLYRFSMPHPTFY